MLISFEGLDRSGKTTLIKAFQDLIATRSDLQNKFIFTKETNIGANKISQPIVYHLSDFLLNDQHQIDPVESNIFFAALRAHNWNTVIQKAQKLNQAVIVDRHIHSSFAYALNDLMMKKYWNQQIALGVYQNKDVIIDRLLNLYLFAAHQRLPDLVFYLKVPIPVLEQRQQQRDHSWSNATFSDAIENQYDQDYQNWQAVEQEYLASFNYVCDQFYRKPKVIMLDGLKNPHQLAQDVLEHINDYQKQKQLPFKAIDY